MDGDTGISDLVVRHDEDGALNGGPEAHFRHAPTPLTTAPMAAAEVAAALVARRKQDRAEQRAVIPGTVAVSGFAAFRLSLARSRERGAPFARAWTTAMRRTHPNGLIYVALTETKAEWQAAYDRQPATPRHAAVGRLGSWVDGP